ncbi:MAG: 23S rRNA (guanosine(2251)-2'-O)-methyltransferase RlmB [Christensenellales bacterium]|jgi:23S rRNA (guanosine2251-2'-O)-methyltransferase
MLIEGKNSILEALEAGKSIDKLYVLKGYTDLSVQKIIDGAREKRAKIQFMDKASLDRLGGKKHQNVIAEISDFQYYTLEDIINTAREKGEKLLMIILNELTDPNNLGNIMRTAEAAGAHGIIIPKNRSVSVTDTVIRVSSGAAYHIKVARVNNINDTIRKLKDMFISVFSADMSGESVYGVSLSDDTAVIIGGEGKGVKPLTLKLSDKAISIPMYGRINSLNASQAAAVIMYEAVRQRRNERK